SAIRSAFHTNQLTPWTKGRQVTGPERDQIAAQLRERYDRGASIRDLMAQTGRSYGWTHRLLRESGAQLRGRGVTADGAVQRAIAGVAGRCEIYPTTVKALRSLT
ncbi:MAG: helix-turn-helix domain-containing protein, partial [Pseudonocardiaceae bacterium]